MKLKSLFSLMRSRPLLSAVVALIAVTLAWFIFSGDDEIDASAYHKVTRSNFLVSIVEGGNLEAVSDVVVRNEVDGDSRVIFIVAEGTYVKKGDLIVELDAAEAEEDLKDQQITFETSSAGFVTADNDLEIMKSTVDSETRAAELAVTLARMDLEKFEELDREQQLRTAALDIDTSEEALKLAEQKFEWSKKLAERGFETKSQVDQDSLAVSKGKKTLEGAQSLHKMLNLYDLTKARAEFKSFYEEAGRELERVKKQGQSKIAQAQADKNSADATLKLNKEKLAKMTEQLKYTKVYSPQDGLAVYAMSNSRFSSETMIEEGAQVRNRQELIKIPDTSKMQVTLKVHESHIGQVSVGQPAFIVLDSLPDQRFRGEVTRVGILPDAQSRYGNPNLKVYSTEVVITDELPDVKPGVSARAEIVVANLQNVITVPIQAVTTVKGEQVCYVKRSGGPESTPVEIGMFNSSFIEIKSGLSEGDEVMLAPPISEEIALDGGVLDDTEGLDLPTEAPEKPKRPAASERSGNSDNSEGGGGGSDRRAQMMKRFDTDGDGELSDTEKAAMQKSFGGGGEAGGGGGRQRGEGSGGGRQRGGE